MSLIRWSPLWDPWADMDNMFARFPAMAGGQALKSFVPVMDVYETDQAVMVETPLAGVDPKDVEVSVKNGVLTVKGQTKKEHEVEEKNYYRKEVRSGSFYREVSLPAHVAEDKVSAEFVNGLLKITCPKTAPVQAKKVSVKVVKK